jgi:hypothetical protein
MTNQPTWKCVANLGDATPWDYGGAFVMVDETGVYDPELWLFEVPNNEDDPTVEYRILLEPCTFQGSHISDNRYHPEYPAWFGTQERLAEMAEESGICVLELINWFCSDDPVKRATAYQIAIDRHGPYEFDQYPREYKTKKEKKDLKTRMQQWLNEILESK